MYGGKFNNSKKPGDKRVTVINKNSGIYGTCPHKTTFHRFLLITDDTA